MDSSGWDWYDRQLAHPDGRATGGEPCVQCGEPIPSHAHYKQRDRHVCSPRCNANYKRRVKRSWQREESPPEPPRTPDPFPYRPPLLFGTDLRLPFPYGFLGRSPRAGDSVDRHGWTTHYFRFELPEDDVAEARRYLQQHPDSPDARFRLEMATRSLACVHEATQTTHLVTTDHDGYITAMVLGTVRPDGSRIDSTVAFEAAGRTWRWHRETIRDVGEDDGTRTWTAPVCMPDPPPEPWHDTMWTPAFRDRSERRKRTTVSTAAHTRRQRMRDPDGKVERIDPHEVYERDGWTCQLCGREIDRTLRAPDMSSASLDHRTALAAGGTHTLDNVQASHLLCNIRKGVGPTVLA